MDNNDDIKTKTISGIIWSTGEKYLTQIFGLVIGIVLARILSPNDYGNMIIASTIIDMVLSLTTGGLFDALIQKKDIDTKDYSLMLFSSLLVSAVFVIALFFVAVLVGNIYSNPILVSVIRVYSLVVPISTARSLIITILQRQLCFKKIFWGSFTGTIVGGIIGIIMAETGFGIWALVFYNLLDALIDLLIMSIELHWRPCLYVSFSRLRELYLFGLYSLGINLVSGYSNSALDLILGANYSTSQLSFYNRGKQYPYQLCNSLNGAIGTVMYPILSTVDHSDNNKKNDDYKNAVRRFLKTSTYVQLPVLTGFAMISKPLVRWILTEKWMPCVIFLQINCLTYTFWPYITSFSRAVQGKGLVNKAFKYECIIALIRFGIGLITLQYSVVLFAVGFLLSWIVATVLYGVKSCNIIDYNLNEIIKDVIPNYLCTAIMAIAVFGIGRLSINDGAMVCLSISIGILIYVLASFISKNESFYYIIKMICGRHKKTSQ